jgi:hypothetical protein
MKTISPWLWPLAILLLFLTGGLGYTVQQSEFGELWMWYGPLFGLYLWTLWREWTDWEVWLLFGTAFLMRLLLIGALPGLSDDLYRFVWDGRLWVQGYNPFDHLPVYYLEEGLSIRGLTPALYEQLNSPEYYTIYPPVAQGTFALAAWFFPEDLLGSAIVLRSFLLLCELGSLWLIWRLLKHFQLPLSRGLIYALNPLIIIEITGNLHYEGAMIFFLLLAFWQLVRNQWMVSAVALALSVASKLLPLMFFPFFLRRLGRLGSMRYFSVAGIVIAASFLPLVSAQFIENFGSSIDLYFRKFEFNASIYYLLRWYGFQMVGYNMIGEYGPALAEAVITGILLMTVLEEKPNWEKLPEKMLFAISLYLLLTTTVHPWYTSLPIVLCLFTRYRYPVVWSGLIMLTYVNYSYPEYHENLWIVAVEYLAVAGWFVWETWFRDRRQGWLRIGSARGQPRG